MNILKYEILPAKELIARIRQTPLRGGGEIEPGVKVYEKARVRLVQAVDPTRLTPPQRYVLNSGVKRILDLADAFSVKGVDVFALEGAIMFWVDDMNPETDAPIPFLPPIVEESFEKDNARVFLVNDGMHRVWAARKRGRRINIIYASHIPARYPYYAYAMLEGWNAVKEFDELPDGFEKKEYRNPDNYKALFRQFNVVFPGVQVDRKKTNPIELKS